MRKQLQYTTAFVVVLVIVLVGALQLVKQMPGGNELTTATVVTHDDCDIREQNNADAPLDSDDKTASCSEKEKP